MNCLSGDSTSFTELGKLRRPSGGTFRKRRNDHGKADLITRRDGVRGRFNPKRVIAAKHRFRGDQTLFMRGDKVKAAWERVDPIIAGWDSTGSEPALYDPGSFGPEDALMPLHRDRRRWRDFRG